MLTTHLQPLSWLCINRIVSPPHLSPCRPAPEELYVATSNVFRNCVDFISATTCAGCEEDVSVQREHMLQSVRLHFHEGDKITITLLT